MRTETMRVLGASAMALLLAWACPPPAHAQLSTQHIKGLMALKSGSQPPPHWYLVGRLLFTYNTDTVKESDGSTLPIDAAS